MTPEGQVLKDCIDYCSKAGIFCQRRQLGAYIVGNRRVKGKSHQADLYGILKGGRHWEYEVKRPGEEPTDKQMEWLDECARAGAWAGWGDSLEDFIDFMSKV